MANSDGYPWESRTDQVEYTRVFIPTRAEEQQMQAALQRAALPAKEIRRDMMRPLPVSQRYGYAKQEPDILTCWEPPPYVMTHSLMDYTSDEAGIQATSRPSLGNW